MQDEQNLRMNFTCYFLAVDTQGLQLSIFCMTSDLTTIIFKTLLNLWHYLQFPSAYINSGLKTNIFYPSVKMSDAM